MRLLVGLCVSWLLAVPPALAGEPPVARREPFAETMAGVEIQDPYRWMEAGGAEFDAYARAEAEHARSTLDGLPERAALLARIRALLTAAPYAGRVQRAGKRLLVPIHLVGDSAPRLELREEGRRTRVLPDLARLHDPTGHHALVAHALELSPDGRHLTVGLVRDGEADPVLRVFDVERGRYLPDTVRWPLFADARGFRPRWLADGSGFFHVRNPGRTANTPEVEREWRGLVYLHRLGTPVDRDPAIFGHGLEPAIAADDTLYVEGPADPDWLVVYNRKANGRELWAAPLGRDGRPASPLRRVLVAALPFGGWGRHGSELFVLTPGDTPELRLVTVPLDTPGAPPREALPAGDRPWSALAVADDGVYLTRREGGSMGLVRLAGTELREVALPAAGELSDLAALPGGGIELRLDTWLSPSIGLRVAPGADRATDTGALPRSTVDASPFVEERLLAEGRDGVQVPVTLLRRRDLPRDGKAKVLLHAYGCFGSPRDPEFLPEYFAWLERGGIFAIAHVRGGGDLGTAWHRAGRDRQKPTVIGDIVDAAAHLVRAGWTSPGRVGAWGESCGGTTVGRAVLERPDLFGAGILVVGALDPTRPSDASWRRSIFDLGDPDTGEGMRRIRNLSPYHAILPGGAVPALLLLNGANDYTIPLWQGAKFVARVRAEAAGGRPTLLRVNWTGGHNISAGLGDGPAEELADTFAFLLWQLGAPAR